jgi:hypothetical protein
MRHDTYDRGRLANPPVHALLQRPDSTSMISRHACRHAPARQVNPETKPVSMTEKYIEIESPRRKEKKKKKLPSFNHGSVSGTRTGQNEQGQGASYYVLWSRGNCISGGCL